MYNFLVLSMSQILHGKCLYWNVCIIYLKFKFSWASCAFYLLNLVTLFIVVPVPSSDSPALSSLRVALSDAADRTLTETQSSLLSLIFTTVSFFKHVDADSYAPSLTLLNYFWFNAHGTKRDPYPFLLLKKTKTLKR